jgi:hypothetical protein
MLSINARINAFLATMFSREAAAGNPMEYSKLVMRWTMMLCHNLCRGLAHNVNAPRNAALNALSVLARRSAALSEHYLCDNLAST